MCWQTKNKTRLVYALGIAQRFVFQTSSSSQLQKRELRIYQALSIKKLDSTDRKLQKSWFYRILKEAQVCENV